MKLLLKRPWFIIGLLSLVLLMLGIFLWSDCLTRLLKLRIEARVPLSYSANIIEATQSNEYYRRVLFTGMNSQLVVMNIAPGTEVGVETHKYTEQTLFFLSGTGEGILNGKKFPIGPGSVVVVVPGTKHNFWNTGSEPLKLYTVYAPPNHIDGRIHKTKADADADKVDEVVGENNPVSSK